MFIRKLWPALFPRILDILLKQFMVDIWPSINCLTQFFRFNIQTILLNMGMIFKMRVDNKSGEVSVNLFIDFIFDDTEDIKPG